MNSRHAERTPIVIRVSLEKPDPLSGTATDESGGELPFEGWLGLLGALSQLVCPDRERGDRSGETLRDEC